jgi:hypothetical protein
MKKICFALILALSQAVGYSAEIFVGDKNAGQYPAYYIDGTIEAGEFERFKKAIIKEDGGYLLVLNSKGGSVTEALKIAELVKELHLSTIVAPNGICASACFFIWLAGEARDANPTKSKATGPVGLHRPYYTEVSNNQSSFDRQSKVQVEISEYLRKNLVPNRLVDLMMSRPSNDIYWLTAEDLVEIGEYPPGVEELYIKKCDYDRRVKPLWYSLLGRGNYADAGKVEKIIDETHSCILPLKVQRASAAMVKFLKKQPPQPRTAEQIENDKTYAKVQTQILDGTFPEWRKVIASKEFKAWLSKQPHDVLQASQSTFSFDVIGVIEKYQADGHFVHRKKY